MASLRRALAFSEELWAKCDGGVREGPAPLGLSLPVYTKGTEAS